MRGWGKPRPGDGLVLTVILRIGSGGIERVEKVPRQPTSSYGRPGLPLNRGQLPKLGWDIAMGRKGRLSGEVV